MNRRHNRWMHRPQHIMGANAFGVAARDLLPYRLTSLPTDAEGQTAIYQAYLKALDDLIDFVTTIWHPINSQAIRGALIGVRNDATNDWSDGKGYLAIQYLACVIGYFNAHYRNPDGSVNWQGTNTPVDVSVFNVAHEAAAEAAKASTDLAKSLGHEVEKVGEKSYRLLEILAIGVASAAVVAGGAYAIYRVRRK